MKKGVTIILCTYNGEKRLPKTLEYIASQSFKTPIDWELIIVDNASTDNTATVAAAEWGKYDTKNVPFSILKETRPGKIYALAQAFDKAQFDYSIICDDDNWLKEDYSEIVYNILEGDTKIGAVGGKGIAVADAPGLPEWFSKYEDGYATGEQGIQSGDVTARKYLWGAGLGTRTELYRKMYDKFPSLLTGRLGKELTAGEDGEYCKRLILAGYKLYYDSRLIFQHFMPASRLTLQYREKLFEGFAESEKVFEMYSLANKLKDEAKRNPINFLRLLVMAPLRVMFANSKKKREHAKNVLILLSPATIYPEAPMSKIKQFYQRHSA
jgi:glycosyltransferase involved in cell wall biosynthesis